MIQKKQDEKNNQLMESIVAVDLNSQSEEFNWK